MNKEIKNSPLDSQKNGNEELNLLRKEIK